MIEVIQAHKDGKNIEYENFGVWTCISNPAFDFHRLHYRVKPEPKPDIVKSYFCEYSNARGASIVRAGMIGNIHLTFDGETNQLKSAELIK